MHFSGLTKETVIATIDQMNTLNFLAHYEPDGYGPLFYEEEEREYYHIADDEPIHTRLMYFDLKKHLKKIKKNIFLGIDNMML